MPLTAGGLRLAQQPGEVLGGVQELERHHTPQVNVLGFPHDTHSPFAKLLENAEACNLLAGQPSCLRNTAVKIYSIPMLPEVPRNGKVLSNNREKGPTPGCRQPGS